MNTESTDTTTISCQSEALAHVVNLIKSENPRIKGLDMEFSEEIKEESETVSMVSTDSRHSALGACNTNYTITVNLADSGSITSFQTNGFQNQKETQNVGSNQSNPPLHKKSSLLDIPESKFKSQLDIMLRRIQSTHKPANKSISGGLIKDIKQTSRRERQLRFKEARKEVKKERVNHVKLVGNQKLFKGEVEPFQFLNSFLSRHLYSLSLSQPQLSMEFSRIQGPDQDL